VCSSDLHEQASAQLANKNPEKWHRRLGHASMDTIQTMQKNGIISESNKVHDNPTICEVCAIAKQPRTSFK